MRWLTRDWATGGLSDDEWAARLRDYDQHLNRVGRSLADGAEELIATVNLHDGQVSEWHYSPGQQFSMIVLVGDLQRGYEWITLTYRGAILAGATADDLRRWGLDGRGTEIIYDEVDRVGESYEHRLLLAPDGEFAIRFGSLAVERRPASPADCR